MFVGLDARWRRKRRAEGRSEAVEVGDPEGGRLKRRAGRQRATGASDKAGAGLSAEHRCMSMSMGGGGD